MTPDPKTLLIITTWLTDLATLCNLPPDLPVADLEMKVSLYAKELGAEFPSAAFTTDSLRVVVVGQPWFPAYATVRERIAAWWRDNRPRHSPAIRDHRAKPLGWDDADERWVDFYHRRASEITATGDRQTQHTKMGNMESLVRCQSSRAATWLGLYRESEGFDKPGPAEIERVQAMLREMREAIPTNRDKGKRDAGSVPLTGEALRQARINTGIYPREAAHVG